MQQGKVEIQGTPADLYGSQIDFAELVGVVETADPVDNDESFDRRISQISTISLAPSIDVENPNVTEFDEGIELEATSKGKVKGSLLLSYFRAGADWPVLCLVIFLFVFVQFLASAVDYWVSYWQVLCICVFTHDSQCELFLILGLNKKKSVCGRNTNILST